MLLGIIILAIANILEVRNFIINVLNFPEISQVPEMYLSLAGLIIGIIGIFIITKSSKRFTQANAEVPIYHKNKIVGYRRH